MLHQIVNGITRPGVFCISKQTIHLSACCQKNIKAGVPKTTPGRTKPLTYEEACKPGHIGVRKGWNSINTSNLYGEIDRSAETTMEDALIRQFLYGTYINVYPMISSEVIIKRRLNIIIITGYVNRVINPVKCYFLKGYVEEFLSNYLKRPVRLELKTLEGIRDLVFKKI